MSEEKIKIDESSIELIRGWDNVPSTEAIKFTSIIILTYNQLEYTKLCIESIRKFTNKYVYEIIVVDNNSTDGTIEWLKLQSDLIVIYNKENLGFPKGCNQGIEISSGKNVLLLNNDTIVTPNWLYNLNEALWSSEDIGAVGAISNSCSYYQQINTNYSSIDQMLNFACSVNKLDKSAWYYRNKLIGYCMMIKKEVLDEIGLLDEIFTPGNFEDDDISFRILLNGYKLILCTDTFVHHFGSVSFRKRASSYYSLLETNSRKLRDKWKFDVYNNNIIHYDLISKIEEDNNKEMNILEIGCGLGATLVEIKNIYKNTCLYGVEYDKNIADIVKNMPYIKYLNLEDLESQYTENKFDYVLVNNILNNMEEIDKYLRILKKCLKHNGHIILNISESDDINKFIKLKQEISGKNNLNMKDISEDRLFFLDEIKKLFIYNGYNIKSMESVSKELLDIKCKYLNYIIKASDGNEYASSELINLKYILSRIDNNIDLERNIEYIFNNYKINNKFIEYISYLIKFTLKNKLKVFNDIGVKAFNLKLYDFSLSMFVGVLQINRNDVDTVYNICYTLLEMKEYIAAYKVIINSDVHVKRDFGILEMLKLLEKNYV